MTNTQRFSGVDERLGGKGMPSGWFQIGWTGDLAIGEVKPVHYFGTDLVLFRGEDGAPRLFDAYCPHLGAHLGYGGCVVENSIQCAFHGWRWSGDDGSNLEVPYGDKAQATKKRLRKWHVADLNDTFIVAWFSPDGGDPTWDLPVLKGFGTPEFYPSHPNLSHYWGTREMHAEWISENAVDYAHFRYVHRTPEVGRLTNLEVDGHIMRSSVEFEISVYGPDGTRAMKTASDDLVCYGIGLVEAEFSVDGFIHLQSQTPVDETHCDLFTTVAIARREDDDPAKVEVRHARRMERELKEVASDLVIWEQRKMDPHPALAPDEAKPHRTFSRWAKQFYTFQEEGVAAL